VEDEIKKKRTETTILGYTRSLIEASLDPLVTISPDGEITDVNSATVEVTGTTREELIGSDFSNYFTEPKKAKAGYERVFEEGTVRDYPLEIKHKNGKTTPVLYNASIYKDEQGNVVGVFAAARDVTELKRAKEKAEHLNRVLSAVNSVRQIIAKEKDLRRLLKGICERLIETRGFHNAWIAVVDESGGYKYAVEAGLGENFSLMKEKLKQGEMAFCRLQTLSQSGVVFIQNPIVDCAGCPLVPAYIGKTSMAMRLEYKGKIYGLISASTPANHITNEEESLLFHDIASDVAFALHGIEVEEDRNRAEKKLKDAQAQMLQSEKMASIGQLAAGVAHEINNPTGFVSSNLKSLLDYQHDINSLLIEYRRLITGLKEVALKEGFPSSIARQMEQIADLEEEINADFILEDALDLIGESREGTERIKKIVLDLKDFAHPGEDKMQVADINNGIESTLNVVWNELKYKATVTKNYGDLPRIKCYPQQLNQVFMNLLVNAAQAMEKEGKIMIATRVLDGLVEIKIGDTGSGIPKDNLSKIFDPFFTTKGVGKGTGLGLNMAYNIIKKHKGTIDVESEVGKGTTFMIRIPVESGLSIDD